MFIATIEIGEKGKRGERSKLKGTILFVFNVQVLASVSIGLALKTNCTAKELQQSECARVHTHTHFNPLALTRIKIQQNVAM